MACVKKQKSVLVIAPPSAGKTFISMFVVKHVLEQNRKEGLQGKDRGIAVYVAPEKALVNQVSANVYHRFEHGPENARYGGRVSGMLTREVSENVDDCQVLVTVPDCLEDLLLSPQRERWVRQIRYLIVDEIHMIGSSDRGVVWERMLTLCTVSGLF